MSRLPRLSPLLAPIAISAALLGAGVAPAEAQSAGRFTLPQDRNAVTGSITPPAGGAFQFNASAAGSRVAVSLFNRFPADGRQLRFDGESGWRDMAVYVRPGQVDDPARLRLRYMNSVAVMPEASRLSVYVNEHPVIETSIEASTEPGLIETALPAGLLEPGYNSVRIVVQQRHRVDCSIQAVNELWTQVDSSASGLVFTSANDQFTRIDDLLGLPLAEDGSTPIIVYLAQGADPAAIDRALRASQALAVRLGLQKPRITFAREAVSTPGIHFNIGTTVELRSRGIEVSPYGDTAVTVSGRASGVVRVSLSGATVADVDDNIDRLAAGRGAEPEAGSVSGLRALAAQRGMPLAPEGMVTLRDIGIASQDFSGRLLRTSFNVLLPKDFYPADNGKATLFLDAAYVPGLLATNEALVRVNGRIVGATRLAKSGGETMRRRPIEMSLKALQPGHNVVTLEIRAETPSDKDCNPLSLLDTGGRITLSDQTSFAIPKIARAAHLPAMSATTGMGFPLSGDNGPTTLFLPKPDFASIGAAATFLARTAVAAGKPIPTRLTLTPPDERAANALLVGSAIDMPANLIAHFGLQKDQLPTSWTRRSGPQRAGEADAQRLTSPLARPAQPRAALNGVDPIANASAGREPPPKSGRGAEAELTAEKAVPDTILTRAGQSLAGFLQRNIGYSPEQLSFLNGGRAAFSVSKGARILVAQAESPVGGGYSWHLLLAPDAATLQRETTSLVSPSSWVQISGRATAIDPAENEVTVWPSATNYYFHLDDLSFSNITLFAAGWLSNNIQYYVLVILTMCGIFGAFTRLVLNRIGSKP